MFTGIIQAVGTVKSLSSKGGDVALSISTGKLAMNNVALGDSIAVNGVCLTAVQLSEDSFVADVSRETLSLTSLGSLSTGSSVNLEKALTLQDHLGGHLVSGHVDGLGVVESRRHDGRSEWFKIKAPDTLAKYIAAKGSITIDGVSLTVNRVDGCDFEINIVPHTLQETIIDGYQAGTKINLEVDLLARYLERLLLGDKAAISSAGERGITEAFLAENGY
ncbi:riboflavin synthase [Leucothrix pacifica]|uniref:Riboflavin synthase n=1 Tax=Leucothrix pacifica TaxID=1247513 RepID=A0A317CNU7_9GAMM|nr:riboflavin synthase [Leucothrix pacifica]PWR00306.1 riboflavin synthase [Leucothrix pacifica]